MQVTARLKNARISAQKVRLVADQVRGMPVEQAEQLLTFSNKKAAHIVKKVLLSAVANAEHNEGADIDELKVTNIRVVGHTDSQRIRPGHPERSKGSEKGSPAI